MLTEQEAINIQEKLRQRVILSDELPAIINIIAGVDVEYDKGTDTITGAIVLMDYNTLDTIEEGTHCMQVPFPYIA
jgi:deoxyribonuclease V